MVPPSTRSPVDAPAAPLQAVSAGAPARVVTVAAGVVRKGRFIRERLCRWGTSSVRLGAVANGTRGTLVTHPGTPSRNVAERNVGRGGGRTAIVRALVDTVPPSPCAVHLRHPLAPFRRFHAVQDVRPFSHADQDDTPSRGGHLLIRADEPRP